MDIRHHTKIKILRQIIQAIQSNDKATELNQVEAEYRAAQETYNALLISLPKDKAALQEIDARLKKELSFNPARLDEIKNELALIETSLEAAQTDFNERKSAAELPLKRALEKKAELDEKKRAVLESDIVDQTIIFKIQQNMPPINALRAAAETYSFNGLLRQQFNQKHQHLKHKKQALLLQFRTEFHTTDSSPQEFETRINATIENLLSKRNELLKSIECTENYSNRLEKFKKDIDRLSTNSLTDEERTQRPGRKFCVSDFRQSQEWCLGMTRS